MVAVPTRKIVIWCGAAPNQKALANKISKRFNIAGIVIASTIKGRKKRRIRELPAIILDRIRFRKIYTSWKCLMKFYNDRYQAWPQVPILKVDDINSIKVIEFTENIQPDLVAVSGTALIKEPLLKVKTKIGIINLHTGLSPYVKGGPNCTNWCIANNTWHLIGNTIMWLNSGIDAGNIITNETIDIRAAEDLKKAHIQVMEHAHDLYLRTIYYLFSGDPPYQSVSQESIDKGKLYLNKMWNTEKRKRLLYNWKLRMSEQPLVKPQTISLPIQIE